MFERKANSFAESLTSLSKNKNIRIKVDVQIEKLIIRSGEVVHFVLEALSKFEKEASAFCGKAYEYLSFNAVINQQYSEDSSNSPNLASYGKIYPNSTQLQMIQSNSYISRSTTIPLTSRIFST